MRKITGKIIKGIGGFYYVRPAGSLSLKEEVIETKPRGVFRHKKIIPMVGDDVVVAMTGDESYIEKIMSRRNAFVRPPVANVDTAVIVFAATDPKPDLLLLDKLLIAAQYRDTAPLICFTKTDLLAQNDFEKLQKEYAQTGFPIFKLCNSAGDDLEKLSGMLADKTAFMAGPSGVGKSTLANRLCVTSEMDTGGISSKTGRGKHTTRHVELLDLKCGGYLLDTPGFSSLSIETDIPLYVLGDYYPEFPTGDCKFNTCTHRSEPGCGVKIAVEKGLIPFQRYERYLQLYSRMEAESRKG